MRGDGRYSFSQLFFGIQDSQHVGEDESFIELRDRLGVLGGKLLVSILRQMLAGTVRQSFDFQAYMLTTDFLGEIYTTAVKCH
jgi:hypothetical protein